MAVTLIRQEYEAQSVDVFSRNEPCTVVELNRSDEEEVVQFLACRPIHTVFMAGLIRDNGLLSPHNRGSFYGYRDRYGLLEGVALVGHATIIEARSDDSLIAFARLARNCLNASLIRGEKETINNFWKYYAVSGVNPRLVAREVLVQQLQPSPTSESVDDLRPASMSDLEKVMAVNASMAFEEGGVSPMQKDPSGFRNRTTRRIEQGRVWVWVQDNRLIFKADVVSETPEVSYLEGVHVHVEERRQGHGLRCLTALSSILLQSSHSICLTVNERNQNAMKFYEKAGYQFHSDYETIYLR
jgi:hypothetical protein